MNLTDLARKHKRARDWLIFAEDSLSDPVMKKQIVSEVRNYEQLLTNLWRQGDISESDSSRVVELEHKLQELHEEARLKGGIG